MMHDDLWQLICYEYGWNLKIVKRAPGAGPDLTKESLTLFVRAHLVN
jgi:hypothetical protein